LLVSKEELERIKDKNIDAKEFFKKKKINE